MSTEEFIKDMAFEDFKKVWEAARRKFDIAGTYASRDDVIRALATEWDITDPAKAEEVWQDVTYAEAWGDVSEDMADGGWPTVIKAISQALGEDDDDDDDDDEE